MAFFVRLLLSSHNSHQRERERESSSSDREVGSPAFGPSSDRHFIIIHCDAGRRADDDGFRVRVRRRRRGRALSAGPRAERPQRRGLRCDCRLYASARRPFGAAARVRTASKRHLSSPARRRCGCAPEPPLRAHLPRHGWCGCGWVRGWVRER